MELRRLIVELDPTTIVVKEFCQSHRISTWFFWDLRRRFAAEGEVVLEPKSRAPHSVANKTDLEVEEAIVAKRKELVDAGLDAGAESIAYWLRDLVGLPTPSTIWRILSARGFIVPAPNKAPKRSGRRFSAERANQCWGLDDTTWALADGTEVKILNVIDDCSRLAVASTALPACTGAAALGVVLAAAVLLGLPARFLSDNASAFRHVLADALGALGVGHGHSRPYHPQTNGKVERFHQTLKRWLRAHEPAATIAELQAQLDLFRLFYNQLRPHRSLGRRTPAAVWAEAPKAGPASRPLGAPTKVQLATVRHGRVSLGARLVISIGSEHNGEIATAVITGSTCHVFVGGRLTRQLTIDPTRRTQPLSMRA